MRHTLEGVTVLDLTQVVSGAVASMMLAEAGADVIKVEPPQGEAYRRSGHLIENERGSTNLNIMRFSRRKRSIAIDLKSAEGAKLFSRLVVEADVLIENFRPGVLARLGFSPERLEELNPNLIYTTVSGFGHDDVVPSLYKDTPTYAIVAEAMAGLMHLAGDVEGPPVWMGFAMADIFAGTLAFAGTLLALQERGRKAPSRRVDIAMYDGAVLMNDLAMTARSVLGDVMGPGQYALQSPWGPFPCTDGYVVVAVLNDRQWQALSDLIGRPEFGEDPRLDEGQGRSRHHRDLVGPAVTAWTRARTKADAAESLVAEGIPSAPVRDAAEVAECDQVHARQMLATVEDPVTGPIELVGNPIKMDGDVTESQAPRIPQLGEHTRDVLRDVLRMDVEEIDDLESSGAIRSAVIPSMTG